MILLECEHVVRDVVRGERDVDVVRQREEWYTAGDTSLYMRSAGIKIPSESFRFLSSLFSGNHLSDSDGRTTLLNPPLNVLTRALTSYESGEFSQSLQGEPLESGSNGRGTGKSSICVTLEFAGNALTETFTLHGHLHDIMKHLIAVEGLL